MEFLTGFCQQQHWNISDRRENVAASNENVIPFTGCQFYRIIERAEHMSRGVSRAQDALMACGVANVYILILSLITNAPH